MPDYGATERVRSFVVKEFFEPARNRGEETVTLNVGKLGKLLEERAILSSNRFPIICGALASAKFARTNGVVLQSREGPQSGLSSKATFTFTWDGRHATMHTGRLATYPNPPARDEEFLRLRGILKKTYEQLGGADAVHREERESWER